MSFRDELERVVRLQAAEIEARELQAELDGLPAARDTCQGRVRAAETAVQAAEDARGDSQKEHRRLEGDLQEAEAQVIKYKEQEMLVKTNQQLWAIQDEMKTVGDRVSDTEIAIIERLEAADALAATIGECNEQLVTAKAEAAVKIGEIDAHEQVLAEKLDLSRGEAQGLRAETDPELVTLYDRIAAVRGGIAVAEGIDGRCTACNVRLRPQVWVQVRNVSDAQQCDACKRIVFARDTLSMPSTVSVGDAG